MAKNITALFLSLVFFVSAYAQGIEENNELGPEDFPENVKWLSGAWGVRLIVRGGEDLDTYVKKGYDYVAGAQEIVDKLPAVGYVITNFTNNAHAHLFTLRNNANVDSVMGAPGSVIDEEFVPSLKNEQVIIDVINTFKAGGKKVILYLNSQSIGNRSSDEGAAVWRAYVANYFDGDEAAARLNLLEGYIKRFAEIGVDGYWLDAYEVRDDNTALINMLRKYTPNVAIGANVTKSYLEGVKVDTDGFDDDDETDYKVVLYGCTDPYSDFSAGHIVPLAQKCPPGSWAYDEFTIADIEKTPVSPSVDSSQLVLKHMFTPIRATWSSERQDLMFDTEKTYRFIKRITEAGGAITFSTTTGDGSMMEDEMAIMEEVNRRMMMSPRPESVPYVRPPGAYLVGEERAYAVLDPMNVWYHNNTPNEMKASVSEAVAGELETGVSTPYTQGNASRYVSKFTRDSGNEAYIKYALPAAISEASYAKFKIRVFAVANATFTHDNLKVVLRHNGNQATALSVIHEVEQTNTWVDYTFDMSGLSFTEKSYNEIYVYFASADSANAADGRTYYFDAFQGLGTTLVNVNFIVKNEEGELLPEVKLEINGQEASTNSVGEADFLLSQGEYTLSASKMGYLTKTYSGDLSSDSTLVVALESSESKVEFHVMNGDAYATNSLVTLNSVMKQPDSLGVVVFEGIGKGTYCRYSIKMTGMDEISAGFMLKNDTIITAQLDNTAGLDEEKVHFVNMYPNPARQFLMIEALAGIDQVKVFSMHGQLLMTHDAMTSSVKLMLPKVQQSMLLVTVLLKDGTEVSRKVLVDF